jgi:hypothetical protein
MRFVKHAAVAIGLTVMGTLAIGAEAVATVGDLARIQAETLVLKARLKQEEVKADLAAKRTSGGVAEDTTTLPVVKSIFGTDRLVATFLYPGNVRVPAMLGDVIPGGYTVARIDGESNKVEITRGKERFVIGFSSSAPVPKDRAAPTQASALGAPTPFVPAPAVAR